MSKNNHILITGATGFVGAYVLRELIKEGYTNIRATHRSIVDEALLTKEFAHVQWVEAELEDYFSLEEAMEDIEMVVHCAAMVSFLPKDKKTLIEVNQTGTRYIVDAALHTGVKRLIYISSVAALGRNIDDFAITEDTKWDNGGTPTNYAISKFLAEEEVWRGQAEGLSVALVYPSIILGAWKWSVGTAKMFAFANRKSPFYPAGHTGIVDVRDVAKAVSLLIDRKQDRDRFLLNGRNLSYHDLLEKMAIALGHPPPHKAFPERWARVLTWLDSWRAWLTGGTPLLTKETTRASYRKHVYDSSLSKDTLGIKYRSIDQTINETATIFVKTKENKGVVMFEE